MGNYQLRKVWICLKKISSCAFKQGNVLLFIPFILTIYLFLRSSKLEIVNNDYLTALFESRPYHTISEFCFRSSLEILYKLLAVFISDLACVYFFYTALESSLSDLLSLKWDKYHEFTLGELLTMQYEKAQAVSKFIYELIISLVICLYQIYTLIKLISKETTVNIGRALSWSTLVHILMFMIFFKTFNLLQEKYLKSKGKARAIVNEEAKNFIIVKSYNLENVSTSKVAKGFEKRRLSKMRFSLYEAKTGILYKFFEIFALSFVYLFYYNGQLNVSVLNTVVKQIVKLYEAMRALVKALGELRNEFHVFYKLEEFIENNQIDKKDVLADFDKIVIENLSFKNVFSNISFTVSKNEKIAVIGKNGSGKTSLLRTLVGFYDNQGITLVKGNEKTNIAGIQSKLITYISPDDSYTQGSVMKNLRYGNDLSREQIIEKCKEFNVHSTFVNLENGYDTVSNSLGTEFSGGQKQRINFMRGVLRDTPILVVDDCLNGVTTIDRLFLIERLLKEDRTIVMTCDKMEILKSFDKILMMNGRFGTFNELESELRKYFSKNE